MIIWRNLAIALFAVGGVACCGIGAISIVAGELTTEDDAERFGCAIGAIGLILLALAGLVKLS